MSAQLQFSQSLQSEQQRASAALKEHGTPIVSRSSGVLADQFSYDPRNPLSRGSSYDQYLYGRSLIRAADEKPDWQQTMSGRMVTRLFTRGIFGALAFTWAGNYASRSLKNYDPESIKGMGEWARALVNTRAEPKAAIDSAERFINRPNTMQAIAKAFDVVAGKPISAASRLIAPKGGEEAWAKHATHFRPRAMYHDPISKIRPDAEWSYRTYGRSLGHEVVAITADFAAASAADAFSRNIVQAIDPNVEKDWYDKDGHFSVGKFGKDWARRTWQVISFNQGEDWAVAVPYAYFMKWHRNVLNKLSPGFKYTSDHASWNGACDKLKAHMFNGQIQSLEKVGDFQAEAAWDLQARFTIYNVLTLMYREAYKGVGNNIGAWWKGDHWLPRISLPHNPVSAVIEGAGDAVRYGVKSFVKANLYMQPSVPFFWLFRAPQCKWRGSPIIINDEMPAGSSRVPSVSVNTPNVVHSGLYNYSFLSDKAQNNALIDGYFAKAKGRDLMDNGWPVGFNRNGDHRFGFSSDKPYSGPLYVGAKAVHDHPYHAGYNPYDVRNSGSLFSAALSTFGAASNKAGMGIGNAISRMGEKGQNMAVKMFGMNGSANADVRRQRILDGARTFADASFAYTPYMIAKAETARRWDNKDMDAAIYRGIDGVVSFNWAETKAAIKDIGRIITNPPPTVEDPGFLQNKPENSKPDTMISAASLSHAPLIHQPHRTLQ